MHMAPRPGDIPVGRSGGEPQLDVDIGTGVSMKRFCASRRANDGMRMEASGVQETAKAGLSQEARKASLVGKSTSY